MWKDALRTQSEDLKAALALMSEAVSRWGIERNESNPASLAAEGNNVQSGCENTWLVS